MATSRKKATAKILDINSNQPAQKIPKVITNKKRITPEQLVKFSPLTANQEKVFHLFSNDHHMCLDGAPGTGKTFIAFYNALQDVIVKRKYKKIVIVRSIVPTRDVGFLPGTIDEKVEIYEKPYKDLCEELVQSGVLTPYEKLSEQGVVEFMPTSFIRGTTINDAIIIVDEIQNLTLAEASSVITRVGKNSKLILCGDYYQSDLTKESEKKGYLDIKKILKKMPSMYFVEFSTDDIVRSDFVKEFILAKIALGYQE